MDKILVSACLAGEPVRYDARAKTSEHPAFIKWQKEGRLIPVCPELLAGLPCPRPPAELQGDRVVAKTGTDVTAEFALGARETVALARGTSRRLLHPERRQPLVRQLNRL